MQYDLLFLYFLFLIFVVIVVVVAEIFYHLQFLKNAVEVQTKFRWLVGCTIKVNCSLMGPGPTGDVPSVCVCGVFLRDPSPYLYEHWRKTTENSEWLGRQAQPGFEPGTSCLPVLSVTAVPLVGLLPSIKDSISTHNGKKKIKKMNIPNGFK